MRLLSVECAVVHDVRGNFRVLGDLQTAGRDKTLNPDWFVMIKFPLTTKPKSA